MRDGALLAVGNRYPNHAGILWGLPGGRQEFGELLAATLVREAREEIGLEIAVGPLLYLSESYDRTSATHVSNATFSMTAQGEPALVAGDAHAVAMEWIPLAQVEQRFTTGVVREPLLAHLRGDARRYFAFADAGITIVFNDPA